MSNFDEALERFQLGDLEYSGGLANHGPMAAEALGQLGHPALIPAFLGVYAPRVPAASPGVVLADDQTRGALGEIGRGSDWVATFEARLADGDWRNVVAASVPDLIPGLFAGAGHGLLRAAHALRSLEDEDSPLRRRELARGLAYWSARYQRLPGRPGSRIGRADQVAATAAAWPLVCEPESRAGFFFDIVCRLDRFPAFAEACEGITRPDTSEFNEYLSALCRFAASAYLSHPERRVAYVHALTIPSAMRLVAPHVEPDAACQGAAGAFQAVAALHSMFGENTIIAEPDEEVARVANDWNEIRYHAACSLEEHAIKMVEACWREDLLAPDPIFRLAAADAALKIDARGAPAGC